MGFTPHAGVWIETYLAVQKLKRQVTPHAGVWIETCKKKPRDEPENHTPCGCVD